MPFCLLLSPRTDPPDQSKALCKTQLSLMGTALISGVGSSQDLMWGKAPNKALAVLLRMEEQVGVQILSMKKRAAASPTSWVTSLTTWTWLQRCHCHHPYPLRKARFAHLGADDLHPTHTHTLVSSRVGCFPSTLMMAFSFCRKHMGSQDFCSSYPMHPQARSTRGCSCWLM